MIFCQKFEPVREEVPKYLQSIQGLGSRLVFAIDTHLHADHIIGLDSLQASQNSCVAMMGVESKAECVACKVKKGATLR